MVLNPVVLARSSAKCGNKGKHRRQERSVCVWTMASCHSTGSRERSFGTIPYGQEVNPEHESIYNCEKLLLFGLLGVFHCRRTQKVLGAERSRTDTGNPVVMRVLSVSLNAHASAFSRKSQPQNIRSERPNKLT